MRHSLVILAVLLDTITHVPARADVLVEVGYTALAAELGAAMPTGAGVRVVQVEARDGTTASSPYAPDPATAELAGKSINPLSGTSAGFSAHATGVGRLFYGATSSLAPAIGTVDVYEANNWLGSGFLRAGSPFAPKTSAARIANHSWIGSAGASGDALILARLDWLVQKDEFIQVTAMGNAGGNQPLLASAYNSIAVGISAGSQGHGSVAVSGSTTYTAGRSRPDLAAPLDYTSEAAPIVASATALLVQAGHAGGAVLSKGFTINRNGDVIYNAERAETIKAVLMAGANRQVAGIADYRDPDHRTGNGLDVRYGAGQVDIAASYHILAAGEQDSRQDGGGAAGRLGFDYDPNFGGAGGSNATASYFFETEGLEAANFSASLAWNLGVSDSFVPDALHRLDLALYDLTADPDHPLALSASTADNTQNLWLSLFGGHSYELRVTAADGQAFAWDYALAWNVAPVPVPGAVWLFGSALAGFAGLARWRRH